MSIKKSIILIIVGIIISGLIIVFNVGFNKDILTREHLKMSININKEFDNNDVKQIVKEVVGNEVEIQKTGDFEDQVVISTGNITDENRNDIVNKLNEKYGTELTVDSIDEEVVPSARILDIVSRGIVSFVIATVIILVYFAIRYKKQGVLKVTLKTVASIVLTEIVVMSIVAILRIPVGQNLNSIIFVTYGVSLFAITKILEDKKQEMKIEETKSKKA